jgi:DNA-binding MarR family transcriptional regulator
MSTTQFDVLIHAPNRLQICAALESMAEIEFKKLRDLLSVSDSVLSKNIKSLEDANYIGVIKRTKNGRQHTWLVLTSTGRKAYERHVKELKKIIG